MSRKEMLRRLQAADFALQDAILYLDTHPEDEKALAYYHRMKVERKEIACRFENTYGPLTSRNVENKRYWDWIKEPWPWETEE